ncbi:MAG: hypothetical protein LBU90_10630 [Bacteroidales bacterium]|jgi:antitoxin component YwqK of YwqJK toxin-antitoxin module|nr:hypothetical protein [Bacteroidales bacterium]
MRNLVIISCLCLFAACSENLEKRISMYHPEGNPAVIEYYRNNDTAAFPAKIVRMYAHGEKEEETNYNPVGERDGLHTFWYMSGDKMLEENFKDGVLDGKATYWNENATKSYEAQFTAGEPSGTWKFYDNEGHLLKEQTF